MLSVVIPTYNEEEFLPKLLLSLQRQTFQDLEIIVADNHSTDRTRQIAREHRCRVVNGGLPSTGRNKGAAEARGSLLLFLDADVVLPNDHFLEQMVSEFYNRDLQIATTFIESISKKPLDELFYHFYNSYIYATRKILPHAHGFCILVTRELHNLVNGFDVDVKLAEDHDYAQRAAKYGKFGVLCQPRIPVSTRRFIRDGYLNTAAKYLLCELHMMTLGSVKSDIFKYRFGYSKNLIKSEKEK